MESFNLYDITGKLIKSEIINGMSKTINVSDLSKGVYLLEINNKQVSIKRKIIIE